VAVEIAGLTVEQRDPPGTARRHPILFVHGMWGGAWNWETYLPFFAERGWRCHALNLRGHHGSKPVADIGRVSIDDYVADARTVAEAIGNPILIGHSMGGLIVQKLAELCDPPAVVAITPAPPRGIFALGSGPLLRAALRHAAEILFRRPTLPSFAEAIALELNRLPPETQRRVYARLVPESGRQAFEVAVKGVAVDAERVRCPMLVIGAVQDVITPVTTVRKIAAKYRAEYREYRAFAHMIVIEPGWERVAGDIAAWLEKVTA
jgi:non-heme chloroperoxidase